MLIIAGVEVAGGAADDHVAARDHGIDQLAHQVVRVVPVQDRGQDGDSVMHRDLNPDPVSGQIVERNVWSFHLGVQFRARSGGCVPAFS